MDDEGVNGGSVEVDVNEGLNQELSMRHAEDPVYELQWSYEAAS
jgi:hypothetical protein